MTTGQQAIEQPHIDRRRRERPGTRDAFRAFEVFITAAASRCYRVTFSFAVLLKASGAVTAVIEGVVVAATGLVDTLKTPVVAPFGIVMPETAGCATDGMVLERATNTSPDAAAH